MTFRHKVIQLLSFRRQIQRSRTLSDDVEFAVKNSPNSSAVPLVAPIMQQHNSDIKFIITTCITDYSIDRHKIVQQLTEMWEIMQINYFSNKSLRRHSIQQCIEQGLTSHQTHYRSYRGRGQQIS